MKTTLELNETRVRINEQLEVVCQNNQTCVYRNGLSVSIDGLPIDDARAIVGELIRQEQEIESIRKQRMDMFHRYEDHKLMVIMIVGWFIVGLLLGGIFTFNGGTPLGGYEVIGGFVISLLLFVACVGGTHLIIRQKQRR